MTDLSIFEQPRPNQEDAQFALTGFDEEMITRRYKKPIGTLLSEQPFQGLRAIAYAELRRGGMKDLDAYDNAMGLTVAECIEVYPEAPETGGDAGKEQ